MRLREQTYAVTTVAYQRRSLFVVTIHAELLVQTILRYREQGRYALHGFVVMPDHLHLLITPATEQTVERCVQYVKGGYSFAIRAHIRGEVWQPGFHEHRVRNAEDFRGQLLYIEKNPERRGLKDYPWVHSKWSSSLDPAPKHLRG